MFPYYGIREPLKSLASKSKIVKLSEFGFDIIFIPINRVLEKCNIRVFEGLLVGSYVAILPVAGQRSSSFVSSCFVLPLDRFLISLTWFSPCLKTVVGHWFLHTLDFVLICSRYLLQSSYLAGNRVASVGQVLLHRVFDSSLLCRFDMMLWAATSNSHVSKRSKNELPFY